MSTAIIVLDIGKTMSKLSLWSWGGELITKTSRANERPLHQGYQVLDVDGILSWINDTLLNFAKLADIGHIIPVAHGAGFAAIRGGQLVTPPLDYEQEIPDDIQRDYAKLRDDFSATGSPELAQGLNAGIQLYFQQRQSPDIFEGATLVPWAQYWSWYLSGQLSSEVTSLGCHTDLWSPVQNDYSDMAKALGLSDKFAPLKFAGDEIGTLHADLCQETGLSEQAKIYCGLHDSNAALIASRSFDELKDRDSTTLSTGTWFIAMRTPLDEFSGFQLPEGRDCLINVDAWGTSIPSARFMGGREIQTLISDDLDQVDIEEDQIDLLGAVADVLTKGAMILPGFTSGFGPFPKNEGKWIKTPESDISRRALICLYAALLADTSLGLIGAKGSILIEGRFARAEVIVRALAALRPNQRIYTSNAQADVSFGALKLVNPDIEPKGNLSQVIPLNINLEAYKAKWLKQTRY